MQKYEPEQLKARIERMAEEIADVHSEIPDITYTVQVVDRDTEKVLTKIDSKLYKGCMETNTLISASEGDPWVIGTHQKIHVILKQLKLRGVSVDYHTDSKSIPPPCKNQYGVPQKMYILDFLKIHYIPTEKGNAIRKIVFKYKNTEFAKKDKGSDAKLRAKESMLTNHLRELQGAISRIEYSQSDIEAEKIKYESEISELCKRSDEILEKMKVLEQELHEVEHTKKCAKRKYFEYRDACDTGVEFLRAKRIIKRQKQERFFAEIYGMF